METICLIIVPLYLPNQTNINDDRSLHGQRERENEESEREKREWEGGKRVSRGE